MRLLKQSTSITLRIGPFVDRADGYTAETGLTPANTDIRLSKDGAAFAAKNSGGATHDENGWYSLTLDATDTGTLGTLDLAVHITATALPVWHHFLVVPANVYDSLVDGSDLLDTQVGGMDAGTVTAAAVATGAIDADALATDAVTEVVNGVWDEALTSGAHNVANSGARRLRFIQEGSIYSDGAIWIDTINGVAGTTDYENGTPSNPVDTLADAITLATSLGITRFHVAPNSSITFAEAHTNEVWIGEEWTLALGGQNIAATFIHGASVTGIGTGSNAHFLHCEFGATTLANCRMGFCRFTGTITLSAASDYYWHDCYSGVAGAGTPVVDFGAAVANTNLSMRRYSGGIQIDNKDGTGTDNMSLEGDGQLVVSASSSGAISVRGNFRVTNTGGATITYDDNTQGLVDVETDTNELQGDWTDGGRLDLLLDAVKAVTDLLPDAGALSTIDTNIDSILADTGTDGVAIATATQQAIADELLKRNVSNVEGTAPEHSLTTLILAALESAISGTTWTIKRTDGSTTHATKTVTVDASADPITAVT